MNERGYPEPEVLSKLKKAHGKCQALRPIWASRPLEKQLAIRALRSCVFTGLLYGLHTLYCSKGLEKRIDAMQVRCLCKGMGIRATHASKLLGEEATSNVMVAIKSGSKPPQRRFGQAALPAARAYSQARGQPPPGNLIRQVRPAQNIVRYCQTGSGEKGLGGGSHEERGKSAKGTRAHNHG